MSALHKAVYEADMPRVRAIIATAKEDELNEWVNAPDLRGNPLLHLAIWRGTYEMVELLLRSGAKTRCKSKERWTALDEAVSMGDRQIIRLVYKAHMNQVESDFQNSLPRLLETLKLAGDFILTLDWHVNTWIPVISRIRLSDTYTISKKGTMVRIDTTLTGFNEYFIAERGDVSYIFKLEGEDAKNQRKSFIVMDNPKRRYNIARSKVKPKHRRSTTGIEKSSRNGVGSDSRSHNHGYQRSNRTHANNTVHSGVAAPGIGSGLLDGSAVITSRSSTSVVGAPGGGCSANGTDTFRRRSTNARPSAHPMCSPLYIHGQISRKSLPKSVSNSQSRRQNSHMQTGGSMFADTSLRSLEGQVNGSEAEFEEHSISGRGCNSLNLRAATAKRRSSSVSIGSAASGNMRRLSDQSAYSQGAASNTRDTDCQGSTYSNISAGAGERERGRFEQLERVCSGILVAEQHTDSRDRTPSQASDDPSDFTSSTSTLKVLTTPTGRSNSVGEAIKPVISSRARKVTSDLGNPTVSKVAGGSYLKVAKSWGSSTEDEANRLSKIPSPGPIGRGRTLQGGGLGDQWAAAVSSTNRSTKSEAQAPNPEKSTGTGSNGVRQDWMGDWRSERRRNEGYDSYHQRVKHHHASEPDLVSEYYLSGLRAELVQDSKEPPERQISKERTADKSVKVTISDGLNDGNHKDWETSAWQLKPNSSTGSKHSVSSEPSFSPIVSNTVTPESRSVTSLRQVNDLVRRPNLSASGINTSSLVDVQLNLNVSRSTGNTSLRKYLCTTPSNASQTSFITPASTPTTMKRGHSLTGVESCTPSGTPSGNGRGSVFGYSQYAITPSGTPNLRVKEKSGVQQNRSKNTSINNLSADGSVSSISTETHPSIHCHVSGMKAPSISSFDYSSAHTSADGLKKREAREKKKAKLVEDELDLLMRNDVSKVNMSTKCIRFEKAKAGIWGMRHDRIGVINGSIAHVYEVKNVCLRMRKRREHLNDDDIKASKQSRIKTAAFAQEARRNSITDKAKARRIPSITHKQSLKQPPRCPLTFEEYLRSDVRLGRPLHMKVQRKDFKCHVWMSEEFPMQVATLLSLLEIAAPANKYFVKIRNFLSTLLPPGFPVRVEIPLIPTVNATLTFRDLVYTDIEDSLFTFPPDYQRDPAMRVRGFKSSKEAHNADDHG
ncbi:hypothetical protein SARC_05047 [Sphaeroforma arctica JP610]|uniref:Ankyrin repeat domain-containing protein n=1 Tax=Sphaeroforma arctica JP610 TaxID=667725 RepID=A0A0L0G0T2_9EUKA|nr:hypothetical protein SARC_05047 [Sphaeroforma arctica JP610]KNC82670.1 hypothetical protein SARC_05047 [Sphaeroforma arctica JP610]|eukprot:XP_014156572.1 hypothetical protein SARC_05047 [Sphaeroforma arctica JP610]